jgi:hypothetical protein
VVVGLLAAACFIENNAEKYEWSSTPQIAGILAINLAVQVIAIIAMRSIGLFYRHYACYFSY